jgi:hypothetical protein
MKSLFIVLFASVFSMSLKAACHNYKEIAEKSLELSQELKLLQTELYQNYSLSFTLRDLVNRAYLDASFLHHSTKSGYMKCLVTLESFSRLSASHRRMSYRFGKFASRRDVTSIESLWNDQERLFLELTDLTKDAGEEY